MRLQPNHCCPFLQLQGSGSGTLVFQRENMHSNKRNTRSGWPDVFFSFIFFFFPSFYSHPPLLSHCRCLLLLLSYTVISGNPDSACCHCMAQFSSVQFQRHTSHPWNRKTTEILAHKSHYRAGFQDFKMLFIDVFLGWPLTVIKIRIQLMFSHCRQSEFSLNQPAHLIG